MKLNRNILVVLAFFLLLVLLAKAAEDDDNSTNENSKTVDLNNNNVENPITNENIQKTPIENIESQEHHTATASFGVYLNIVG